MPPSTAKIGVPQAAATMISAANGQSRPAANAAGFHTSHAPTARPAKAITRWIALRLGVHTVRSAIRPKANGRTVCAIQVVMPAAMTVPASRSLITSS